MRRCIAHCALPHLCFENLLGWYLVLSPNVMDGIGLDAAHSNRNSINTYTVDEMLN